MIVTERVMHDPVDIRRRIDRLSREWTAATFEDECPNEEPPKLTAFAMMHAPDSSWPAS
jgi:hypothetical protein